MYMVGSNLRLLDDKRPYTFDQISFFVRATLLQAHLNGISLMAGAWLPIFRRESPIFIVCRAQDFT